VIENIVLHHPNWLFLHKDENFATFQSNFPKRAHIDLAIIDASQIPYIKELKSLSPSAKVIVICEAEDELDALKAFHYSAVGYINNVGFKRQISYYLEVILAGGALISPSIAKNLIDSLSIPISESSKNNYNLTRKEIEVIHFISMGYSYDKIGSLLDISKSGVSFHVKNIFTKLQVNNRVDAIRKWNNPNNSSDSQQEG
jgi:DNA-binding NarL/FixJ family response regulator